jgi:hypothetical protein
MSLGTYGNVRFANVDPKDVEIFYIFTPSRDIKPSTVNSIPDATQVLSTFNGDMGSTTLGFDGMYNLRLPKEIFNQLGIYSIFIRPKQVVTTIIDCGVLAALPDVKGIVLDTTRADLSFLADKMSSNGLVGYQIEYIDTNGKKLNNFFTLITSSNRCEPVTENISNSSQKSVRYRFTNAGSLLYLTLTPSSSSTVKTDVIPFIGNPNQKIILSNTYFEPIMLEVELVEHDFNTLAIGFWGEQVRNVQQGEVTYYDKNRNIYKQYNVYQVDDTATSQILYEVKKKKDIIDLTQNFDDINANL